MCCAEIGVSDRTARDVLFNNGPANSPRRLAVYRWGLKHRVISRVKEQQHQDTIDQALVSAERTAAEHRADAGAAPADSQSVIDGQPEDMTATAERLLSGMEAAVKAVEAERKKNPSALASRVIQQQLEAKARDLLMGKKGS